MILKPSTGFQKINSGGDGSRNWKLPVLRFGNKNMPRIGTIKITFECHNTLRAPTFITFHGKIKVLFNNIVYGKFELGS